MIALSGPRRLASGVAIWLVTALVLGIYNGLIAYQLFGDGRRVIAEAVAKAEHTGSLFAEQTDTYLTFAAASLESLDRLTARLPPVATSDDSVDLLRSIMAAKASSQGLIRGFFLRMPPDGQSWTRPDGCPHQ
jgi:hypothetical protein